ncbi:MAG: isoprenylcysteine carboxylmethyltransferase family protein [Candidatus ainarchaeum sp.]|nr:isoprenylcysteine carboxylmethyltransferase family protein [Candidatus ainarchaeum sp.]
MTDLGKLKIKVVLIYLLGILVVAGMLFLPAGSLDYWQGWAYLAIIFIPILFVGLYFLKNDPEFIVRRLKTKEKERSQKKVITFATILFIIGFLIPGFDYRFHWSEVPLWLVILSDILLFFGYIIVFLAFRENSYASRVVEVEKGQKVISTGLYALVRHPMYFGVVFIYLFTPLALGSFIAFPFFAVVIFSLFFRIRDEEKLLLKELKGYKEYCKKVKYKLLPYIW